jgi:hypothetical protein
MSDTTLDIRYLSSSAVKLKGVFNFPEIKGEIKITDDAVSGSGGIANNAIAPGRTPGAAIAFVGNIEWQTKGTCVGESTAAIDFSAYRGP